MRKEAVFGLIAAGIPLIGYLLFQLTPLVISFVTMFVDMKGYQLDTMVWNNFENFKTVVTDGTFWLSLRNTAVLLLAQFVSLLIALVTSTFLAQKLPGSRFFTALFFVPYICSSVAISIIWMTMFNNDYGIINDILVRLAGEGAGIEWFNKPVPFFMMIFFILLWQAPGYGIVMYNAAFTAVPQSLYEASRVDGAREMEAVLAHHPALHFAHHVFPADGGSDFWTAAVRHPAGCQLGAGKQLDRGGRAGQRRPDDGGVYLQHRHHVQQNADSCGDELFPVFHHHGRDHSQFSRVEEVGEQ